MTESASGPASSGVVLGIVLGLLMWLLNYVDPVTMIILIVILSIVFAVAIGLPARYLIGKIRRERAAATVVPPAAPVFAMPPPPVPSGPVGPPAPAPALPVWPLFEPLVFLETNQEKNLLLMTQNAGVPPDRLLLLLAFASNFQLQELGLSQAEVVRISRVEGEDVVPPGDLDKIGYLIEKHFGKGQGYKVVLSSIETLVEANGPKNVRRLLDVAREVAMSSRGSMLVSLDPKAIAKDPVAMLERGATLLKIPIT